MAPTGNNLKSSIALALAGMTESVNIPKPCDGDPGQQHPARIAAKSAPAKNKTGGLPTPPNSISPSLPPQASIFSETHGQPSPPADHVDSDIDLDDAIHHARAQDSPQSGLIAHRLQDLDETDAFGDITPLMLAKHHLPGILIDHGPLAIRYVMGYLTTSVPGFSGMPPAKARRLVVAALEGRGEDGVAGALNPEVRFEKVGWGRWDARKRGQPPKPRYNHIPLGLQIPKTHRPMTRPLSTSNRTERTHPHAMASEHDADKMSLDGSAGRNSIENDFDVTDEEDWASVGAAALREGTCPLTGESLRPNKRRQLSTHTEPRSRGRGITKRPSSNLARSLPSSTVLYGKQLSSTASTTKVQAAAANKEFMDFSSLMTNDNDLGIQDREAVEALLRMRSI